MNLYNKIKEDYIFASKNSLSDAKILLDDLIKTIEVEYISSKKKISDKNIHQLIKKIIKEKNIKIKKLNNNSLEKNLIKFQISILKRYAISLIGKRAVIHTKVGSTPLPHVKNLKKKIAKKVNYECNI